MGIINYLKNKLTNQTLDTPISTMYTKPKVKTVDPTQVSAALRQIESSGGTDPNTPRNMRRRMEIPAANANEKRRSVDYDIGYGGEYGLTPVALANLAMSKVDRSAPVEKYTKYGMPLLPGKNPIEIQRLLNTQEGAAQLAQEYFMSKRTKKDDYSPEALTEDYMENYLGGPSNKKSYTKENRARVLEYFKSIAK